MATLGYVRSSNGPDLAQVGANEQLVSHVFPNTTGETLRITSISAWVGNWSGTAIMRFGIWAASSSSAGPGALLARTVEFSPTVNYVDAAGGQLQTIALETPYELAPGQVIALGVASRNNSAGIAMFEAADISQPNESFFRRGISGTNLISAGGEVSNQGQLAMYVTGTTNDPPDAPILSAPSGTVSDGNRTPVLQFVHRDPNGDRSSRLHVQVRQVTSGDIIWDYELAASIQNNHMAYIRYDGPSLGYYVSYQWRAQTRDEDGEWGPLSGWQSFLIQHNNRSPLLPLIVSGTGTQSSLNIQVVAEFRDPDLPYLDDGQQYERFDAKHVYVMRVSDNVNVVNTGIIDTTTWERANSTSVTSYTLPAWNTEYIHYERHRDRRGAWSDWIAHQIRAVSGPSVDAPSVPSGRVTNPANPGNISAVYRNSAGLNTNAIQYELRSSTGARIRSSPVFARSLAPGGVIENGWGPAALGTLANDTEYRIVVRARDTAGNWSPPDNYSTIVTNAAPNTPSIRTPQNGRAMSSIPALSVYAGDDDQPSSERTVTIEGYTNSDVLISSHTAPYDDVHPNPNVFTLASPPFVTGYGTYKWRSRSFDGYLYSSWSPMWTFTYAAVPSVTITSPAGPTATTSQPAFAWVGPGQTHWRVRGYDGERLVYDTGERVGSTQSHTISGSQYWIGGERWNNHETFQWLVSARDASTLWGDSDLLELTLEYVEPAPLIVSGEAMTLAGAKGTHYARVEWSQTEYTEAQFLHYDLDRAEISGPGGEHQGEYIGFGEFARVGDSATTDLVDFDVTSNQWYRVGIKQVVQQGVDVIESAPVYVEYLASWHGTLLHMPFDPINTYVWLPYGTESYEPEVEWFDNAHELVSINGRAPHMYSGNVNYSRWILESTLIPRDGATVQQQRDAFRRLWNYQNVGGSPTGRPESVCFREGRGGEDGRLYGRIAMPRRQHRSLRAQGEQLYTFAWEFVELEPAVEDEVLV